MSDDPIAHAGFIVKRNGAWFIQLHETEDSWGDADTSSLYDCASSMRVAKRVAREMAESLGWEAPFRWSRRDDYPDWYDLTANEPLDAEIIDVVMEGEML